MACPECDLHGGPFSVEEAAVLAATHNRLHHGGAPTASAMTAAVQASAA
jgi:hypothetical protein